MIKLLVRDLNNPLEGTFDLSCCGDTGKYLSISTGYRKERKPENASKVEIWICPRFLIEKEFNTTASYFKQIMANWTQEKAPVGLFWTNGWWGSLSNYDYLTSQSLDKLSNDNLYVKWKKSVWATSTQFPTRFSGVQPDIMLSVRRSVDVMLRF